MQTPYLAFKIFSEGRGFAGLFKKLSINLYKILYKISNKNFIENFIENCPKKLGRTPLLKFSF